MTLTQADLLFTPVTELAAAVHAKTLSPVELVDASLEAIARLNPKVNAVIQVLDDRARTEARESEARVARGEARALEGIPIPIKDIVLVEGTPLTLGSRVLPDFEIPFDSEVVRRLRSAGAVIIGKTHMPEFGSTASSESLRWGATRNPWNLDHTPGGSSSGSAAAVAAGMVPAAHGMDGGGSLRIPASCCALFTVKPTRGRISQQPINDVTHNNNNGFLTHTVADNALLMDLTEGRANDDPYWSSPLERPLVEEVGREAGRLRIGFGSFPPYDTVVHPAVDATLQDAAALCADLGHEVEEHKLDWRDDDMAELFLDVWSSEFGFAVESLIKFGADVDQLEPHNRALWERSKSISAARFLSSYSTLHDHLRRVTASWERYDVVLTPITAVPPLRIGEIFLGTDQNPMAALIPNSARFVPYCSTFNFTGQPAAAWPLGWHEGLPLGVQAVGRMGDEATLFRLSAQVEAARPWADRRPPLS